MPVNTPPRRWEVRPVKKWLAAVLLPLLLLLLTATTFAVDHGYGYMTRYAHISKSLVKTGQEVKRGEEIAKVGNSGKSTAPHLHYEVIKNGKTVNPINFFFNDITEEEYDLILELSELPSQTMD